MANRAEESKKVDYMSDNFDSFISGTLLGDAFITKEGSYAISHSIVQNDYLLHKQTVLQGFGYPSKYSRRTQHTGFSTNDTVRISSGRAQIFKEYRSKWYPNGTKIVPEDFRLNAESLAYWFMDDGNANLIRHYNSPTRGRVEIDPVINKFRLYTDGFDDVSQDRLKDGLLSLGISSGFYVRTKNNLKYIMIWDKASKQRLKDLVDAYIVPSMRYKVDTRVEFSQ